ncbi:hypothetical protein LHJ74_29190 [Streptomyces sp. N2-109]|uniref:Uncharacterized protein n=1 Tax=Streptomyces gossypii TaxID=2883101 RepID=A0ABT2K325_9ACTN|nr:protein phosphatase 1 regulatory subunit 42 [Streptomyces gossypii]MCT2593935.1 hypothetical protein [Streptomyces gossypii]
MSSDMDAALRKSLIRAIGHDGPFTDAEYMDVTDLHIRNSRNLFGLEECRALELLTLVACDPVDLGPAAGLQALDSLTVRDSGLRSLTDVSALPLLSCYAPRNFITDITPLMGAARLGNLDVTGNPLSEHSYRDLVPRLAEQRCRVLVSDELEWKLTHHLHAQGVPVSCYRKNKEYRLCRPGLGLTDSPEYAHPVIQESDVTSLLTGDPHRVHVYFEDAGRPLEWTMTAQ